MFAVQLLRGAVALTLVGTALVLLRGCYDHPLLPIYGYENNDQACGDGIDNDVDGATDCDDAECVLKSNFCGEVVPDFPFFEVEGPVVKKNKADEITSVSLHLCHDRIDNDDDGNYDCGSKGCNSVAENCCSHEFTDAKCQDGVDNDNNNFADCDDFSCRKGLFVTVCKESSFATCFDGKDNDRDGNGLDCTDSDCKDFCHETSLQNCRDGKDNDNDGPFDCADPDCAAIEGCSELVCNDALDNDSDSLTDCADRDCAVLVSCRGPEDTIATCSDGIDNDANGFTDCADFSCKDNKDTAVADACKNATEDTVERCGDGKDNDANGFTDCADFSCSGDNAPGEVKAYCASVLELTVEACSDGKDNDGNGFTDCADFSCSKADDQAVKDFCAGLAESTVATCGDGKDNDANGFTDCSDFSCSRSVDQAVLVFCAERLENTFAKCSDGKDNDGNGFLDCNDNACSEPTVAGAVVEFKYLLSGAQNTTTTMAFDQTTGLRISYTKTAIPIGSLTITKMAFDGIITYTPSAAPVGGAYTVTTTGLNKATGAPATSVLTWPDAGGAAAQPTAIGFSSVSTVVFATTIGTPTFSMAGYAFDLDPADARTAHALAELVDPTLGEGGTGTLGFTATPQSPTGLATELLNTFPSATIQDAAKNLTVELLAYCATVLEVTFDKCNDGIDNDGNGFADCDDFSCLQHEEAGVRAACQESLEGPSTDTPPVNLDPNGKCSDGKDNDGDGFKDCDDWDCSYNPAVTVCKGKETCG